MNFPKELQEKINLLKARRNPVQLGKIKFDSPYLLAPMAAICNIPFRRLMEDLGAGGTVSELISSHGINHGNERTMSMLKVHPQEINMGIQLFGEDPESMAKAAEIAQEFGPKFLDINMGCPVKKVVSKGGGSALLKDIKSLAPYLASIKKVCTIPLSIKIRTGWDADQINADEIIRIAYNEGIEWVAIHGRTRAQQYSGQANWEYIESLCKDSPLPLIGNGDLHRPETVYERMKTTKCDALMIARGALRNPFIFLEAYAQELPLDERIHFEAKDYWPIIQTLYNYTLETFEKERTQLVQIRKLIIWFAAGFPRAALFRSQAFQTQSLEELMDISEDYFLSLAHQTKYIDYNQQFMTSGHG